MSLTLQETVDEILTRFKEVWDTTSFADNVIWPDVPISDDLQKMISGREGVALEPYVRITVRPNVRNQRSLGSASNRLYTTNGILFVEVFTPSGDGMTTGNSLCTLIRNAFEGISSPYHVWYNETRILTGGVEGLWNKMTVTAQWESEERR